MEKEAQKFVDEFMAGIVAKNAGEPEFHQAVKEVAESLAEYIVMNPVLSKMKVLERIAEPERVIIFRVPWLNDKGEIELTLYSERVVNLYDDYLALIEDHTHVFNWQMNYQDGTYGNVATTAELADMLNSNRALFYFHMLFIMDELRDLETDFGILPYPKYEAAQANYGHLVSAWHSEFLCIPQNVNSLERSGYVTELLAYQGKKLMTPAYYEKTLVGQYTRDEESAEMLDIIFATRVFDVGIYYNLGGYKDKICSMLRLGDTLTNVYETNRSAAEQKLEGINELFRESTAD